MSHSLEMHFTPNGTIYEALAAAKLVQENGKIPSSKEIEDRVFSIKGLINSTKRQFKNSSRTGTITDIEKKILSNDEKELHIFAYMSKQRIHLYIPVLLSVDRVLNFPPQEIIEYPNLVNDYSLKILIQNDKYYYITPKNTEKSVSIDIPNENSSFKLSTTPIADKSRLSRLTPIRFNNNNNNSKHVSIASNPEIIRNADIINKQISTEEDIINIEDDVLSNLKGQTETLINALPRQTLNEIDKEISKENQKFKNTSTSTERENRTKSLIDKIAQTMKSGVDRRPSFKDHVVEAGDKTKNWIQNMTGPEMLLYGKSIFDIVNWGLKQIKLDNMKNIQTLRANENNREVESKISQLERKLDQLNNKLYMRSMMIRNQSLNSMGGSSKISKFNKNINYAIHIQKQFKYLDDITLLKKKNKRDIIKILDLLKIKSNELKKNDMVTILSLIAHTKYGMIKKYSELKVTAKILGVTGYKSKPDLRIKLYSRLRRFSSKIFR